MRWLAVGLATTVAVVSAQLPSTAEIFAALERERIIPAGSGSFESVAAATILPKVTAQVSDLRNLKKDEFETTPEFETRRNRLLETCLAGLPARMLFQSPAESAYDADSSRLTVQLPSAAFAGNEARGVSVSGGRFPDDFLEPGSVILDIPRDAARALKPALAWAVIARLPLDDLADAPAQDRIAALLDSRGKVAVVPVGAFLYSRTDGSVVHQLAFSPPPDLRLSRSTATIKDWLAATEEARARAVSRVFSARETKINAATLLAEVQAAISRNRASPDEPVTALVRISQLPKPSSPVLMRPVRPQYPFEMRRAGTSGEVIVAFEVQEDGKVSNARAARSSQREFEAAAIACVSKWVFKPAMLDGKPIAMTMQVPISFSLNEE